MDYYKIFKGSLLSHLRVGSFKLKFEPNPWKYILSFALFLIILPDLGIAQKQLKEIDYVNPLVGTSLVNDGGTMPCVGPPFAMTNFTAQTRYNKMGTMPYIYEDSSIFGFLATHQPTEWMGDYGYVSLMPQIGKLAVLPKDRAMRFLHKEEVAKPNYYKVILHNKQNESITTEMTSTSRSGIFKFSFPPDSDSRIIIQGINVDPTQDDWSNKSNKRIQLSGHLFIDTARNEIIGYNPDRTAMNLGPALPNFKGYFVIKFNQKITSFGTWSNDSVNAQATTQSGYTVGAYVNFKQAKNSQVIAKLAVSFISLEQAKDNLEREIPGWDFQKIQSRTGAKWQKALERVKITTADIQQKYIFYTALFHSMLFPREFSEYGRYYGAGDDKIHEGISYNDYSLWDTYRALHPLFVFTQPGRINGMIQGLLQMYQQSGWLPMWPNPTETNIMISTHADAVITDAFIKGFKGYDTLLAYQAVRKDAFVSPDSFERKGYDREEWNGFEGRVGLKYYHTLGYVPADKVAESVSRTIEYGIDDYCIATMAKAIGRKDDGEAVMKWSRNYKNLYNSQTDFYSPRLSNGQWGGDTGRAYTEGSMWTYLFGAVQDIDGMIELMGGKAKFVAKLNQTFEKEHYVHDNEPDNHYMYLYDYCDQPWKTQELVRKCVEENYFNNPQGINGNDDCGQMSALYIFSTMGFYPVTPASGIYAVGAPQAPQIDISFDNFEGQKRHLTIKAENFSKENKYVASVTLNGIPIKNFIKHEDLMKGGVLKFSMTNKPVHP